MYHSIIQYKTCEAKKLNKKILALSLLLLLTTVYLTSASISTVKAAGEGLWITAYKIEDANTGQVLMNVDFPTGVNTTLAPILPGASLKVTFTINVVTSGSGNLQISTSLHKTLQDKYWELVTQNYTLGNDFNPNSQSAKFNWVKGTFSMLVYGSAPTTTSATSLQVNVVSLYGPTGGVLDQITVPVVTAKMDQYQTLLAQKEANLNSLISSGVSPGYIELYTNVLNESKTIAAQGYVDGAIALLNGLDVANAPVSSTMESLFLPIVVVLAAIAVVFVIMFLRVRGKISYLQLVVEDQIKDLEGLTLRASKIDRTMSSNLESVKDRLKRLVGM